MKNKALIFVYNDKKNKFLLVLDTKRKRGAEGITISQILDKNRTQEEIMNGVKTKIGVVPKEILSLDWGSVYHSNGEEIKEMNYVVFIDSDKIGMDDLKYEWLNLDSFVTKIDLNENKELLKKVLIKAIKKEVFFNKKEREEPTKK